MAGGSGLSGNSEWESCKLSRKLVVSHSHHHHHHRQAWVQCAKGRRFFKNYHEHKSQFLFFLFVDWCFSVCQQHWQWALCGNSRNSSSWRNCHRRIWMECKWHICQWKYLWCLDYLLILIKITLPNNLGLSKFGLGNTCFLHRCIRANVIYYLTCPSHWKKMTLFCWGFLERIWTK